MKERRETLMKEGQEIGGDERGTTSVKKRNDGEGGKRNAKEGQGMQRRDKECEEGTRNVKKGQGM